MKIIKINNINYFVACEGRNITIYKKTINGIFKQVINFNSGYGLCSNTVIQGLIIYDRLNTKFYDKDWFKEFINQYYGTQKILISVQNVTKSDYNTYIQLGFKDYYRLPATYTSSYSSGGLKEKTNKALSIMICTYKDLKPSFEKTMELISDKKEVKNFKQVICIEDSKSKCIKNYTVYNVLEEKNNLYKIKDNNKRIKWFKSSRFQDIIFNN